MAAKKDEMSKPLVKYMPSMAAFHMGGSVVTTYPSGCQRNILFASLGVRDSEIHPIYSQVGELNEERHQAKLVADPSVLEAERERPIKGPILGRLGAVYSGRVDFLVTKTDGSEEVHECKGVVSRPGWQRMKLSGEVKLNHLAQIVSYMIQLEIEHGLLVYGYYQYSFEGELYCDEVIERRIGLTDEGIITVDGAPTIYSVADQLHHMQMTVTALQSKEFGLRPASEDAWSSPCRFCPFQRTCTEIDTGNVDFQSAVELAQQELENQEKREPVIYRPKRKPKEKK